MHIKYLYAAAFAFISFLAVGQPSDTEPADIPVQQTAPHQYTFKIATPVAIQDFEIESPGLTIGSRDVNVKLTALTAEGKPDTTLTASVPLYINDTRRLIPFKKGQTLLSFYINKEQTFTISNKEAGVSRQLHFRHISGWVSLLPPAIAILLALIFKEVVVALFAGIFSGALLMAGFSFDGIITALARTLDKYILHALADADHMAIILFSLLIGGMVALISKNGGMAGIVDKLARYARSPKSAQLVTWGLGVAIFFDDYANTLVVGNTMRPVTDRFRISREKLAYLVDSTAAPVACVALVTTWIGAELGYINDALAATSLKESAYSVFLNSLQFSFYPFLTLAFMLMLLFQQKDFGPMLKAERRARTTGVLNAADTGQAAATTEDEFEPKAGASHRMINALLPIVVVISITLLGLLHTGFQSTAPEGVAGWANIWAAIPQITGDTDAGFVRRIGVIIGNADAYKGLLWGSLAGVITALLLSVLQRILTLNEAIESMVQGFKAMIPAMVILTLAWALAEITADVKTADYLTSLFF